jgi:hypothetical protein
MVPELMSYQATIIKCAKDFHGLAWVQYDRAYRRQVAQTKEVKIKSDTVQLVFRRESQAPNNLLLLFE